MHGRVGTERVQYKYRAYANGGARPIAFDGWTTTSSPESQDHRGTRVRAGDTSSMYPTVS
jgi:hypothetical protein